MSATQKMIKYYRKAAKSSFAAAIFSCAAIIFASASLCVGNGNKYIMLVAIIINSAVAVLQFQRVSYYRKKAKEESENCGWCAFGNLCLKNPNMPNVCINKELCSDYLSNKNLTEKSDRNKDKQM